MRYWMTLLAFAATFSVWAGPTEHKLPSRIKGKWPKTWKEVIRVQKAEGWDVRRPKVSEPGGLQTHQDVGYVTRGERELKLDLYLPRTSEPPPLVVIIHGGGWKKGSKESQRNQAVWFASRGYAVAAIQYRLSGEAKYPAAIEDCRAAVDWLTKQSAKYGYDPRRIAAWGGSAGAHLTALVATTHPDVKAALVIAGPVDLMGERVRQVTQDPESSYVQFLGGSQTQKPKLYEQASPMTHVSSTTPPVLFVTERPLEEGARFLGKLKKNDVYCETMLLAGGIHGHWNWEPWFTATMERCDAFLKKVWATKE